MKKFYFVLAALFIFMPLYSMDFEVNEDFPVAESEKDVVIQDEISEIYLRTNVSNARVYINGEYQGATNLLIKGLVPADYYLKIEKEGFKTVNVILKTVKNMRQDFYFTLEKIEESEQM